MPSALQPGFKSPTSAAAATTIPSYSAGGSQQPTSTAYESAEQEKARLQREDRERILSGGPAQPSTSAAPPKTYESAEEEKERLKQEERDRLLREGHSSGSPNYRRDSKDEEGPGDGATPPPYQDF